MAIAFPRGLSSREEEFSTVYCRALGLTLLSLVHLLSGSDAVSRRRWFALTFASGRPFHLERRFPGDDLFFLVQLVE